MAISLWADCERTAAGPIRFSMTDTPISSSAKQILRQQFLAARLALPAQRRLILDRQLCAHIVRFMAERPGNRISGFWPFRGEPDLTPVLKRLHEAGREIYLPVLRSPDMVFGRWHPDIAMRPNRFGIPEPHSADVCSADNLDWVLMPMLAFSSTGTRLGMGGGFYDRTFGFLLQSDQALKPVLVGVAYSLQEAPSLPLDRWDVPLSFVMTDLGVHKCGLSERDPTAS